MVAMTLAELLSGLDLSAQEFKEGNSTMTRLQKFVEKGAYGEGPGRTAYVLDSSSLPQAADGMKWQEVVSFSAADEVFSDPGIKAVFKAAIDKGWEIVTKPTG